MLHSFPPVSHMRRPACKSPCSACVPSILPPVSLLRVWRQPPSDPVPVDAEVLCGPSTAGCIDPRQGRFVLCHSLHSRHGTTPAKVDVHLDTGRCSPGACTSTRPRPTNGGRAHCRDASPRRRMFVAPAPAARSIPVESCAQVCHDHFRGLL